MNRYLLDVNVLIALNWPRVTAHQLVSEWFEDVGRYSYATCALTQAGFVRVLSNPAYPGGGVSISQAQESIRRLCRGKGHLLWQGDIGFCEAVEPFEDRIFGHKQVTDAYLLGLAIRHKGVLVTLDKAVGHLAGKDLRRNLLLLGN